jgi:hypothetical protein
MAHDTKEANRQRQKRHRDKKRAVTNALVSRQAQFQLGAAANCIKCASSGKPCPEHKHQANIVLKKLRLGTTRGSYFARKKTRTGGNLPDALLAHGRAVGPSRYTGPTLTFEDLNGSHSRDEFIKEILPWFTEQVRWLAAETIRINPHCHHEDDVAVIVRSEAIDMLNAELAKPKEQRAWT